MRIYSHISRFDERSRGFGVAPVVAGKPRRTKLWACPVVLNQGSEGACTGFAVAHHANAKPAPLRVLLKQQAMWLYERAKQIDEWPGEGYDGSSVLAAVKAAREKGWVKSFSWAFGEDELALAIGYVGPAVLGIPWLEGMENPDKKGFIHATGPVRGGHAILCNGYDAKHEVYRLHNSWGKRWGAAGECWISAEDVKRLLSLQGEACVPRK
jgi:hypothetical protein